MKQITIKNGDKFNKLTVISEVEPIKFPSGKKKRRFQCQCDCGTITVVYSNHLKSGNTKSCGCHNRATRLNNITKHNLRYTKEYTAWVGIKRRCLNSKSHVFKYYGGRGIEICDRWKESFVNFYNDMGPKPSNEYSIDRINVDGNYEPNNCRWSTRKEQANNKQCHKL